MTSLLLIEREDRVLKIVLNRPEKRNAFNTAMCREFIAAVEEAQDDDSIGSILIGASGRVFCAGMDLNEAAADDGKENIALHEKLFSLGRNTRKPIVASINGPALGGGVGIVAQAHVAVAAQGALFGLTEIRTGIWPFLVYRCIEEAIGSRRAMELSLTGRLFSTQEALAWGLIHQVAHAFEMEDRAAAIARDLAKASPDTMRLGFACVHGGRDKSWEAAGAIAAKLREECTSGADFKEGVEAFRQHREAHWPSMPEGTYLEAPKPLPENARVGPKH